MWLTRAGASARAYSSAQITWRSRPAPRPPCSRRQVEADPAAGAELLLPGQAHLEALVLAARAARPAQFGELAAQVLAEPLADLGAERFVGGGRSQVHGKNIPSACLGSQLRSGPMEEIPFHPAEDIARYRAEGEWGEGTVSDLVAANAATRGSAPALIGDRGALTWARYDELGTSSPACSPAPASSRARRSPSSSPTAPASTSPTSPASAPGTRSSPSPPAPGSARSPISWDAPAPPR